MEVLEGNKEIKNALSPEWLRECVMIDKKHSAVVISPKHFLEHGITNLTVAQGLFCGKTILRFRFDFDLIKIKKNEPVGVSGKARSTNTEGGTVN